VKKQHVLLYILVSVVDVEGNYFVVKAYQYTTVTSVQVLLASNCTSVHSFLQLVMFVELFKIVVSRLNWIWSKVKV